MADPITAKVVEAILMLLLTSPVEQTAGERPNVPKEFLMPRSGAELGQAIIKCYHSSARFHSVDVVEKPWSRAANYAATSSALININWYGFLRRPIQTRVALVARDDQFRTVIQADGSKIAANKRCRFDRWTKVAGLTSPAASSAPDSATAELSKASHRIDFNRARVEIEALIESASAVALGGKKIDGTREAVRADLIAELAKRVLAAKAALRGASGRAAR